jgi:hypothetical protein
MTSSWPVSLVLSCCGAVVAGTMAYSSFPGTRETPPEEECELDLGDAITDGTADGDPTCARCGASVTEAGWRTLEESALQQAPTEPEPEPDAFEEDWNEPDNWELYG